MTKPYQIFILAHVLLWVFLSCNVRQQPTRDKTVVPVIEAHQGHKSTFPSYIQVSETIRIRDYFKFIDSLVVAYDSLTEYPLSEHLLIRANPWIIDVLENTDYYRMMQRDSFVYDQKQMVVLRPMDSLLMPDKTSADTLLQAFAKTYIDVNLPEFKLRIIEDSVVLYRFPIRVGQNRKRYLKMGDRITDLRTQGGKGQVIDFRRNPAFYNPVDGKRFYLTRRDDEKTTLMPQIPWIETEINGVRNGQLIHPTTNPKTLGKASSNGCIGVREADAWVIYYYAPIGTMVRIRYDLVVPDSHGGEEILKDIYGYGKSVD
ncbi:MAG: L,D-transpeptidase [Maribacter sp.]|nr:L,D-transpeptidase [Maribacter sp.]